MTQIYAEKNGNQYKIFAKGHTGDIETCNYITGILYALAGYIQNNKEIQIGQMRMEKGNVSIAFWGDNAAEAAFDMAIIGLLQLENSYPDSVQIDQAEKNKKNLFSGRKADNALLR